MDHKQNHVRCTKKGLQVVILEIMFTRPSTPHSLAHPSSQKHGVSGVCAILASCGCSLPSAGSHRRLNLGKEKSETIFSWFFTSTKRDQILGGIFFKNEIPKWKIYINIYWLQTKSEHNKITKKCVNLKTGKNLTGFKYKQTYKIQKEDNLKTTTFKGFLISFWWKRRSQRWGGTWTRSETWSSWSKSIRLGKSKWTGSSNDETTGLEGEMESVENDLN